MTYGLRREGIQTSVLVLEAGTGVPESFPQGSRGYGPTFGLNEKEIEQVARHKIAVLHLGNVRSHVIFKTKEILSQVDIPAVVVAQCPMDMEDFAREGIRTSAVNPPRQNIQTLGEVVDIVNWNYARHDVYPCKAQHSGQGIEQASGTDGDPRGGKAAKAKNEEIMLSLFFLLPHETINTIFGKG